MCPGARNDLPSSRNTRHSSFNEVLVRRSKQCVGLIVTMTAFVMSFICPLPGQMETSSIHELHERSAPTIVLGFVGGFVHRDDLRHSEVQLIQQLQAAYGSRVRTEVFDNHHIKEAHSFILRALDLDGDGQLSEDERQQARIVLFGHSWGASAAVYLARDLQRDGIPVFLTVQYAPRLIEVHGCMHVRRDD